MSIQHCNDDAMSATSIELDFLANDHAVQDHDLVPVCDIEQDLFMEHDYTTGFHNPSESDMDANGVEDLNLRAFDAQDFMSPPALSLDVNGVVATDMEKISGALSSASSNEHHAHVQFVPLTASNKRKEPSTTPPQRAALSEEEVLFQFSLGYIELAENDDTAGALVKGGNKSNDGDSNIAGNLSKAKEPTQSLYVWRRDDGLNCYTITEYYATVFQTLDDWITMNIPEERRGTDGPKHYLMTWSWFKLENKEERDGMYQAILSNKKEGTQNKRRKAMDMTEAELCKKEVNQVGKLLGEMGVGRDGKRKDRLYFGFRFKTHQWNKQGWRLTKARNHPRQEIKPWKWVTQ